MIFIEGNGVNTLCTLVRWHAKWCREAIAIWMSRGCVKFHQIACWAETWNSSYSCLLWHWLRRKTSEWPWGDLSSSRHTFVYVVSPRFSTLCLPITVPYCCLFYYLYWFKLLLWVWVLKHVSLVTDAVFTARRYTSAVCCGCVSVCPSVCHTDRPSSITYRHAIKQRMHTIAHGL